MTSKIGLRSFAKDSAFTFMQQIWAIIVSFLTSILLARGLGVEDRGRYAIIVVLATLTITFLNTGLESSITYYVARKDYTIIDVVQSTIAFTVWLAIVGVLLAFSLIVFAHHLLFPQVSAELLLWSLLLIPPILGATNLMSVFRGLQDFRVFNLIEAISQPIALILTLMMVWWLHLGIPGAVIAVMARYVVSICLSLWILKRRVEGHSLLTLRVNRDYARKVFMFGLRTYPYNIVTFLNLRIDVLLLTILSVSTSSIGLYDLAVMLGERLWVLTRSVSLVTFSRVAALKDAAHESPTVLIARYVLWLSLFGALVVYLLADWGIVLLFGQEFSGAATALRLLLPGIVMFSMGYILSNDITGRGKPEQLVMQSILAAIINVVFNLLLIPRLNFIGAGVASSISYSIFTLTLMLTFSRLTGASWRELIIPTREDVTRLRSVLHWSFARFTRK